MYGPVQCSPGINCREQAITLVTLRLRVKLAMFRQLSVWFYFTPFPASSRMNR